MLAGTSLEEVIAVVGEERMGLNEHNKAIEVFGIGKPKQGAVFEPVGRMCLGIVLKKYPKLWLSINDGLDVEYAHAVLWNDGNLYDPEKGINPHYPWTRYFARYWAL